MLKDAVEEIREVSKKGGCGVGVSSRNSLLKAWRGEKFMRSCKNGLSGLP